MCLDKYTNSKQLCITKVQKVKKKNKQSSQPRISGAIFTQSQYHSSHENCSYVIWRIKEDNGKFHVVLLN